MSVVVDVLLLVVPLAGLVWMFGFEVRRYRREEGLERAAFEAEVEQRIQGDLYPRRSAVEVRSRGQR